LKLHELAINRLHDVLDADPDNADIMSQAPVTARRETMGALTFYDWALRAEPDHRGANEYLGELYPETNQIDKAMQQLEKLDNIWRSNCKEYSTLKKVIESFKQTASNSWPLSNRIS